MYDACVSFVQGANDKQLRFCAGRPSFHSQLLDPALKWMVHIYRCHALALSL